MIYICFSCFFFFSSRRRHTRCLSDWSSDVCSSDLSASGGLTIALDALGETYLRLAAETGIDPALMHRIAVIGSGTLDSLPHNGAVVTLLAVCGSTHSKSYFDMVMANIVGPVLALVAVIFLGSVLGSF